MCSPWRIPYIQSNHVNHFHRLATFTGCALRVPGFEALNPQPETRNPQLFQIQHDVIRIRIADGFRFTLHQIFVLLSAGAGGRPSILPSFQLFILPAVFKGRLFYGPKSFGSILPVFKRQVTVFAVMGDLAGHALRLMR